MKMWKKKASLILAAALVLTSIPEAASANEVQWGNFVNWTRTLSVSGMGTRKGAVQNVADTKFTNGTKGSFIWSFQAADGVLTIEGRKTLTGSSILPDYTADTAQDAPWICQDTDMGKGIKKIVLKGTIQEVGAYNFYGYANLEEVDCSGAAALTTLGNSAFATSGAEEGVRFTGLNQITILGVDCFSGSMLEEIALPSVKNLPARCFKDCIKLKTVSLSGLEQMGIECFSGCSSMTVSPDLSGFKGTALPDKAFYAASALSSVSGLAENTTMTTLGNQCFEGTALAEATLPAKVRTLGASVFAGTNLTELPGGMRQVTSVGFGCFRGTKLTEVVLPNNITKWNGSVFSGCESLKRVTIEEGSTWTEIPRSMFYGCTSLEQVVFPETCKITTVSSNAFEKCTALTEFTFPSSVTKVEEKVFNDASNLLTVKFMADSITLDWGAFDGTYNETIPLQQVLFFGTQVSFSNGSQPRNHVIPNIYVSTEELQESVRETLSSHEAYAGDAEKPEIQQKIRILTEEDKTRKTPQLAIELTESSLALEDIQKGASFQPQITKNTASRQDIQYCFFTDEACTQPFDAENIYKVPDRVGIYYMKGYLSENTSWFSTWSNVVRCRVEGLLEEEFYSFDTQSKKLVIKATVDQMLAEKADESQDVEKGDDDQDGNVSPTAAETEEKNFTSEKQLPWNIFQREIQTVDWADGVNETRIGDYMFSGHTALTQITLPEGIVKIGNFALQQCSKLSALHLPKGIKSLGDKSLTSIHVEELILPEGLETIGASAFEYASVTAPLQIPTSVTKLGAGAFQSFRSTGLLFPEKLQFTEIPDSCFAKLDLSIGGEQAGNAKIFRIPDGITRLGVSAFMDSKLTRIEVPASVTRIEKSAFQGCSSLKQIALLNKDYTAANISQATIVINYYNVNSVFANTPEDCMICCDGLTYDLLGEADSYNYGRKLYSVVLMEQSLKEVTDVCDTMVETDYPKQAWTDFEETYTKIKEQIGGTFTSVLDKVLVVQQAEEKVIAAAVTLLQASVQDAGTLEEKDYTEESWADFFYAYDELSAYFDTYGSNIEKQDLSYLVEVNAEMETYRELLVKVQQTASPEPGESASPEPGESASPEPGESASPEPGVTVSPTPGETASPGPGGKATPIPGNQTPGGQKPPALGTPTKQPKASPKITLKKPKVVKAVSKKKKKINLQWKKVSNASGYQVAYGYKKNMKKAKKVTVKKAATVKMTLKGLKSKKMCYVRIRAWKKSGGKKVYSSWSAVKKVKVK